MSEYIGNRIVPRHDGVWDKAKEYEPLTIVYEESTGDSAHPLQISRIFCITFTLVCYCLY